jgi:putative hydrolase of the HAD superfamily
MHFTTIFFDLDNTLYPASTGLWQTLKERMNAYMRERVGIPPADIPGLREEYFRKYGTTLRGLQANHSVDPQDFLAYVHDVPLQDYLRPDPGQHAALADLGTRNLIFTNADLAHARRVLQFLQLEDCFTDIIDINRMDPYCKPDPAAFALAMKQAGESDPGKCVMIDDLPHTTRAARALGLYAVLYGAAPQQAEADAALTDWRNLASLLNGAGP